MKKLKNHIYGEFVTIQEKFKFLGNSPILLFNDKFLQFDRTFFLILKNGHLFRILVLNWHFRIENNILNSKPCYNQVEPHLIIILFQVEIKNSSRISY